MNAQREHRVPLCGRALEILCEAGRPTPTPPRASLLVWCSRAGAGWRSPEGGISKLVKILGIAPCHTASGRAFGTGPPARTNHRREVIEAALAYVVQNRVEAAYAGSDLFETGRGRRPSAADRRLGAVTGRQLQS